MGNQTVNNQNSTKYDVAIIGAGLAGSLCAHLIAQSGLTVCVIDKSRGTGGRASSKKLDDGTSCDLGTPFIHASHASSLALMEGLVDDKVAAPWQQLNTKDTQAFVGIPKMSAITRHWLGNAPFISNTRVHHLEQITQASGSHKQWLLRDDKYQAVVVAEKVIITAPAPQAAMILATHTDLAILLLRANQACQSSQAQWAMWLETPISDLNALIAPHNSPICRMLKDNHKPMRDSAKLDRWVIQTSPEWTKQYLDADKALVASTLIQAFSTLTEQRVIQHGEAHRWLLSRFNENKGNNAFAWDIENNIGLAGDWLCQGDAEGALLSALALCHFLERSHF
ncbi:NAD(P)/FAD-dependent oxidoreductase [Marinomonas transparens]|uniref:NAD(P)-binding protein n=1 Tax=Marinomonas transparens TaxID=2795388 RepID=A0A934JJD4_9GAMM|nr:FAD-dependent oxidoreductase [Marinomonas transparens]MBJ7536866.1 NAD(P)-binding protein [Marinomonas transparens]